VQFLPPFMQDAAGEMVSEEVARFKGAFRSVLGRRATCLLFRLTIILPLALDRAEWADDPAELYGVRAANGPDGDRARSTRPEAGQGDRESEGKSGISGKGAGSSK
jgi:hypothetical protein